MNHSDYSYEPKILVIDDEPLVTRILRTALCTQGYLLRIAANGVEGIVAARDWNPDLVITDLSMPQMDGIELCRQLRGIAQMPIIVLSVFDNDRMKREALEAGADDYLTKPFNLKELQARIRAKLRRRLTLGSDTKRSLVAGDFKIEVADRLVTVRGSSVRLDLKQFELLLYLAEHANQVCTHRALLYAIGGSDADDPDYVHMYVAQLRRQIETSDEPRYLVTERSTGYRFRPYGNAV